jgi:glutamyl-Q tRNA(Asp) synthetase
VFGAGWFAYNGGRMSIVTRFAPSPTGYLHLGHAYSAFRAWTWARQAGGILRLRLEDIDAGRCRPEYAAAIPEDLAWLGLDWDGDIRVQSAHLPEYRAALDRLAGRGLLYPCFCSRAEIARAQAAPHGAEAVYPGTCRGLGDAERAERMAAGAPYALRLDVSRALEGAGDLRFFEEGAGWVAARPELLGDVVLARRDVPTSYHLCVVHDDAMARISHVVRGEDLRMATHIHVLLQCLLGVETPAYRFHRLITDESGKRLAKRDQAATLRGMRAAGVSAAEIRARLEGMA